MVELSLPGAIAVVVVAAAVIMVAGPRMVRTADRLADVTGLGEAFVGAVLLGASTSLPDIITTVTPAVRGLPDLAVSNALGGVLAQTVFLAVADLAHRRANLEHAAASLVNIVQASLLIALLGGLLVLFTGPQVHIWGIHPGSVLLVGAYVYGLRLVSESAEAPMWRAVQTDATQPDIPDEPTSTAKAGPLWWRVAGFAVVLAAAGFALAIGGESLVVVAGLQEATVGVFITGAGTSLAELVVAVSAVRAGALTLAVANVIGGNVFDTLLVAAADVAYRPGSVYGAVGDGPLLIASLGLVATSILVLGLLRRERHGVGNIGAESAVVIALYVFALIALW